MSTIKIKAWLDSGADADSKYQTEFEVDAEEWAAMTEEEKDEYAKDHAWEKMEWGWEKVE